MKYILSVFITVSVMYSQDCNANNWQQYSPNLEYCDLDWDPSCLTHYKSKKTIINTVSIYQARKPIYSSSSNSNYHYESFLSDYFQKLSTID